MNADTLLNWPCDYCGKPALTVSSSGAIYCTACGLSNGTSVKCPRCNG